MLFLTCTIGGDRFAINATRVVEVLPAVSWRRVSDAPHGVVGLLNYHRAAVPLLDLSVLILGTPSIVRMHTRILMIHADMGRPNRQLVLLGLLAEARVGPLHRDLEEFVMPDEVTVTAPYLGPIVTDAQGIVQCIEIDYLMSAVEHDRLLDRSMDAA